MFLFGLRKRKSSVLLSYLVLLVQKKSPSGKPVDLARSSSTSLDFGFLLRTLLFFMFCCFSFPFQCTFCVSDRVNDNSCKKSKKKYTFGRVYIALEKWVNKTTNASINSKNLVVLLYIVRCFLICVFSRPHPLCTVLPLYFPHFRELAHARNV